MTDWADGIETRNYGIKNELDIPTLSELMRIIVALAMVAGALLFIHGSAVKLSIRATKASVSLPKKNR